MSTNTCSLIGWLEINQATTQEIDGHESPVLHGFIHTDKTYYGGKHPITLVGKQAPVLPLGQFQQSPAPQWPLTLSPSLRQWCAAHV